MSGRRDSWLWCASSTAVWRLPELLAALVVVLVAQAAFADCAPWRAHAAMGIPRQEIGVAAIGDAIYAIGGFERDCPSAAVEVYDRLTDRWQPLAPLPRPLHHVGAAAIDGTLYAIGGLAGGGFAPVADVFAYDPLADAWRARAPLPTPRGAMGVAVIGGRIYAAGGSGPTSSVGDFAAYDPLADAWTVLPSMPTPRNHLAATAIADEFYAVGGRDAGTLFARLEVFDPARSEWTTAAPMPTARGGLMAAAVGGRLFAFGGEGNRATPFGIFPQTEAYDPAADRWETLPPMLTPRHGTVAVSVAGAIYIPGGADREGLGIAPVNESFVPSDTPTFDVRRFRVRAHRMRVRGRISTPPTDPATTSFTLRLLDGDDELAVLSLPPGALRPAGRRLRYRDPNASTGVIRAVLTPRRRDTRTITIAARLALPTPPPKMTLELTLGGQTYCGASP